MGAWLTTSTQSGPAAAPPLVVKRRLRPAAAACDSWWRYWQSEGEIPPWASSLLLDRVRWPSPDTDYEAAAEQHLVAALLYEADQRYNRAARSYLDALALHPELDTPEIQLLEAICLKQCIQLGSADPFAVAAELAKLQMLPERQVNPGRRARTSIPSFDDTPRCDFPDPTDDPTEPSDAPPLADTASAASNAVSGAGRPRAAVSKAFPINSSASLVPAMHLLIQSAPLEMPDRPELVCKIAEDVAAYLLRKLLQFSLGKDADIDTAAGKLSKWPVIRANCIAFYAEALMTVRGESGIIAERPVALSNGPWFPSSRYVIFEAAAERKLPPQPRGLDPGISALLDGIVDALQRVPTRDLADRACIDLCGMRCTVNDVVSEDNWRAWFTSADGVTQLKALGLSEIFKPSRKRCLSASDDALREPLAGATSSTGSAR